MISNRRDVRAEDGFTMVEVLVATMLLGIVLALLGGVMISVTSATNRGSRTQRTQQEILTTLRTVSQDIRSGTEFSSCDPASYPGYGGCLKFNVPRSGGTGVVCPAYQMQYSLYPKTNPDRLVASRQNYQSATNCTLTTAYSNKVLISQLTTNGSDLFSYFGKADGTAYDTTADAASIPNTTQVKISVVANTGVKNSQPVRLSTLAATRNNRTQA